MENLSHEESHWDNQHGILPWLVDGLKVHHPNCRLSVPSTKRQDLVLVLGLLAQSSNLYSLTITFDGRQKLDFNTLLRVASTYPNPRNPNITSHNIFGPKHFHYLNANDSTCLYLRNQGNWPLHLEILEFDGIVLSMDEHRGYPFTALLEWPRLRKLSLTDPTNFSVLMKIPIDLRSLRITPETSLGSIRVEDVEPCLCCLFNSQRLEELDVSGCTAVSRCITTDVLNPLKSTLRSLKIHGNEDQTGICKRKAYSVTDLECLGNTMGKLEHLSLDLNYEREWMRTSFRQSLRWEA